jgi:hypothetical protein
MYIYVSEEYLLWDMILSSLIEVYNISEELTASIFRVNEQTKQATSMQL